MSKWPELNDRNWPSDIPQHYLVALQEGGVDTLKATAMVAVILGLMRRVDELERQLRATKDRMASNEMSAALNAEYNARRW